MKKLETTKNRVKRNKNRFLIGALVVTTVYLALLLRNKRQFDSFLEEHGLLNEFYYDAENE